jgi:hypothetical protein
VDTDEALVYLDRSNSLPVNLSLYTDDHLSPYHPFFAIIPHAIGRLGSLSVEAAPERLQDITDHLSRPVPLLEKLSICSGYHGDPRRDPVLAPTLLGGGLSLLRSLCLESVRTELPWRNMVNLTSFKLYSTLPGEVTVRRFLDFFESAPRLRKIGIYFAIPTTGAQDGRLLSLACLERMEISGDGSASLLLDHLLIPVGVDLTIEVDLPDPPIKDHPPRFLNNLKNFPNFTTIELYGNESDPHMQFSGPNGEVRIIPRTSRVDVTCLMLESLDQFDTSKVEQLKIDRGNAPSSDPPYRALLSMKHLRTLTLRQCAEFHIFTHALHPDMSASGAVVCPKLEELVIVTDRIVIEVKPVIGVVAARASRGAKLESIRIVGGNPVRADVLELEKHVLRVEYNT